MEKDSLVALFDRLYDETFSELRRFTALRCADVNTVPDILQDTYFEFYRILQKKGERYAENPRALLYKIAKRNRFFQTVSLTKTYQRPPSGGLFYIQSNTAS